MISLVSDCIEKGTWILIVFLQIVLKMVNKSRFSFVADWSQGTGCSMSGPCNLSVTVTEAAVNPTCAEEAYDEYNLHVQVSQLSLRVREMTGKLIIIVIITR